MIKRIAPGARVDRTCENSQCGLQFHPRTADVRRGRGRFCSKRCKATQQERLGGSPTLLATSLSSAELSFTDI